MAVFKRKISLKNGKSSKYKKFATAIIIFLLCSFISKPIYSAVSTKEQNGIQKLNSDIQQGSSVLRIMDQIYFEESSILQMSIYYVKSYKDSLSSLSATVSTDRAGTTTLPVHIEKIREDYYVLYAQKMPKNWSTVLLKLRFDNDDENANIEETENIRIGRNESVTKAQFETHNIEYYELQRINHLSTLIDTDTTDNRKAIKKMKSDINRLEEANVELNADFELLTKEKQEEVTSKITSNINKISTLRSDVAKMELEIDEMKETKIKYKEARDKLEPNVD